jgi:hypothetical protein
MLFQPKSSSRVKSRAQRRKLRTIFWHVYYFLVGIKSITDNKRMKFEFEFE